MTAEGSDAASESEVVLRWAAHAREHELIDRAIITALEAVNRERLLHAAAHEREHILQNIALEKAEHAADVRFSNVNAFREQLREQANRLATQERVDTMARETERRFDEVRTSITNIEKLDVKGEGKQIGQGTVIAAIVGAVGFAATGLGLLIVLANLITAHNPA